MRVLHTSDWHIGRTFHGRDLLADQESVLGGLADLITEERVDVLLVAGDLYDRAVPSADAVETCMRIFARLREAGATIIVTSGNHDSAARVGAFARFTAAAGLHLRTRISELAHPVLLDDEHGQIAFYGIPYLEPDPAKRVLESTGEKIDRRGHTAVLTEAMRRIRADLEARGTRSVVLAHAFVTGAEPSESERAISVGGVEQVAGSVFDGVDYVALGHLHGPQKLAQHLRYSGSPLAYSFSEATHRKSVWIVDLDEAGLSSVRRRELPVPRPLATISGTLEHLVSSEEFTALHDSYVSAKLTDEVRPVDAMRRLQQRFPYAVHLEWNPPQGRTPLRYSESVRGLDDHALAESFVENCRGSRASDSERELLAEALHAVAEVRA